MQALVDERITNKRAAALLYEHQIAANNVRHSTFGAPGQEMVIQLPDPPKNRWSHCYPIRKGRWRNAFHVSTGIPKRRALRNLSRIGFQEFMSLALLAFSGFSLMLSITTSVPYTD